MITKEILDKTISYLEYRKHTEELLAQNKTKGNNQSEQLANFTKLNVQRMNRLDKTITISEELALKLKNIKTNQTWVVIAEAWCGDCAQLIPYIDKLALSSEGKITLQIIYRDENPQLMDCFVTNSTRSIPKLIALNQQELNPVFIWGPRPKPAQEIMLHYKANKDSITWNQFELNLHSWYSIDKGQTTLNEISQLLKTQSDVQIH